MPWGAGQCVPISHGSGRAGQPDRDPKIRSLATSRKGILTPVRHQAVGCWPESRASPGVWSAELLRAQGRAEGSGCSGPEEGILGVSAAHRCLCWHLYECGELPFEPWVVRALSLPPRGAGAGDWQLH